MLYLPLESLLSFVDRHQQIVYFLSLCSNSKKDSFLLLKTGLKSSLFTEKFEAASLLTKMGDMFRTFLLIKNQCKIDQ